MKTLHNLFLDELADIYDAEHQLVKALPQFATAATCSHLKETLLSHGEESKNHILKLEHVFSCFHRKAKGRASETTLGLLREGGAVVADFVGSPALNAALISVMQKVEHYEIASYGCLRAWAERLGKDEAADLLSDILEEEKAADVSLTKLALGLSNNEAMNESRDEVFVGVGD